MLRSCAPNGVEMNERALDVEHEATLVRRARDGDRSAFATLVRSVAPRLESFALRLLGDRHDAQDVTQDAVLEAWRGIDRFRGEARFGSWMHRILLSRSYDRLRRRRPMEPLPDTLQQTSSGPVGEAGSREFEALVRTRIDRLPPTQRATLLLRLDSGLSYEEIAYVLGSTRNAVRSNLVLARKRLALELRGHVDLGGGES